MKIIMKIFTLAAITLSFACSKNGILICKPNANKILSKEVASCNNTISKKLIINNIVRPTEDAGEDQAFIDEIILIENPVQIKYVIEKKIEKSIIDTGYSDTFVIDSYALTLRLYINKSCVEVYHTEGGPDIVVHHIDNKYFCTQGPIEHMQYKSEFIDDLSKSKLLPCKSGTLKVVLDALEKPELRDLSVVKLATDEQGRSTYELTYYLSMNLRTSVEINSDNKSINLKCDDVYNRYDILGSAQTPIKHRFQTPTLMK